MKLSRVRIVLVAPSHPGNVGAVARAMKTMGHSRLYLVRPSGFPSAEASARAVGAGDLLAAAQPCTSLEEALRGCRLVYATSARRRSLPWPEYTPDEAARQADTALRDGDVAVVFGREQSGLSNRELDHCQAMIRIPTAAGFRSLNLAAAVQLVCYEFYRAYGMTADPDPAVTVSYPDVRELERFYAHLEACAVRIGFFDPARPRRMRRRIRLLCSRARPDRDDLNMLRGFLRAAMQAAGAEPPDAAAVPGDPASPPTAAPVPEQPGPAAATDVAEASRAAYHARMAGTDQGAAYRAAGVDIGAGHRLVQRIRGLAAETRVTGVMDALGGFAAAFDLSARGCRAPVLVAATDGVGTKLRLLSAAGHHRTAGLDLVAMCANDVICRGARPLFFLDYMAFGRLDEEVAGAVAEGIAAGCREAGMALIGGETAEMPGFYRAGEYDLAGFCVGLAEPAELLDERQVAEGDALIGLASSGAHANGYALIRRLLEATPEDARPPGLMEMLLAPTRLYTSAAAALRRACAVRGIAHVTGGGLPENVARILPGSLCAVLDPDRWERPRWSDWLRRQGGLTAGELFHTFNCGVGLVACVPHAERAAAAQCLADAGERAWVIGHVAKRAPGAAAVRIAGVDPG